jgi:hypothetical protein
VASLSNGRACVRPNDQLARSTVDYHHPQQATGRSRADHLFQRAGNRVDVVLMGVRQHHHTMPSCWKHRAADVNPNSRPVWPSAPESQPLSYTSEGPDRERAGRLARCGGALRSLDRDRRCWPPRRAPCERDDENDREPASVICHPASIDAREVTVSARGPAKLPLNLWGVLKKSRKGCGQGILRTPHQPTTLLLGPLIHSAHRPSGGFSRVGRLTGRTRYASAPVV